MTSATMMNLTLALTLAMMPRIYFAYLKAQDLYQDQEMGLLRELLAERNLWMQRQIAGGVIALALIWVSKSAPGMAVPEPLSATMGTYAASSLLLALLESLVAQKIARLLASVPVRVSTRD
jgi:hypothetical protein